MFQNQIITNSISKLYDVTLCELLDSRKKKHQNYEIDSFYFKWNWHDYLLSGWLHIFNKLITAYYIFMFLE